MCLFEKPQLINDQMQALLWGVSVSPNQRCASRSLLCRRKIFSRSEEYLTWHSKSQKETREKIFIENVVVRCGFVEKWPFNHLCHYERLRLQQIEKGYSNVSTSLKKALCLAVIKAVVLKKENVFWSCQNCGVKDKFWVLVRNRTSEDRIPCSDALPLLYHWATGSSWVIS